MYEQFLGLVAEVQKLPPEQFVLVLFVVFAIGTLMFHSGPTKKLIRAINTANQNLIERLDGFEDTVLKVAIANKELVSTVKNFKPEIRITDAHIRQIAELSLKFDPNLKQQILALAPVFDALKQLQYDDNDDTRDFDELAEWVNIANQTAITLNKFQPPQGMPIEAIAGELELLDKSINRLNELRYDDQGDERDFDQIEELVEQAQKVAELLNGLKAVSPAVVEEAARTLTAIELAVQSVEAIRTDENGDERDLDGIGETLDKLHDLTRALRRISQAA